MENEKDTLFVQVPLHRYEDLVTKEGEHEALMSVLLETAKLDYRGKDLTFDDDVVKAAVKRSNSYFYNSTLQRLHEAAKAKEEAN